MEGEHPYRKCLKRLPLALQESNHGLREIHSTSSVNLADQKLRFDYCSLISSCLLSWHAACNFGRLLLYQGRVVLLLAVKAMNDRRKIDIEDIG